MVEIKKMYTRIKHFIISHYKLSVFFASILFFTSCIAVFFSALTYIIFPLFAFSLLTILRLITYKTGKIPIFMIDKTWETMRLKHSKEEAEKLYETMSLKRASVYFMIAVASFLVWSMCEVALFVF